MLRDQLIENVREPYLRWELKKQVTNEPENTFITCRKTAIQWSTETIQWSTETIQWSTETIQWSTETGTKKKVRTSSQIVEDKPMRSLPRQRHSDQVVKMLTDMTEMMAKEQTLFERIAHKQQELAKNQEELHQHDS